MSDTIQNDTAKLVRKTARRIRGLLREAEPRHWPVMHYDTVDLAYWTPPEGVNFGDELSRTIVELMLARKGLTIFDQITSRRQLIAVGSILDRAHDGAVIWGTGLHGAVSPEAHRFTDLDVRAVRGPLTRRFLRQRGISVPEIYGDPALLLPLLTGDRFTRIPKERDVGFVPHYRDLPSARAGRILGGIGFIDPLRSWNAVVSDILKNRFIVAGSLHGIIIAEAFAVPARYVRLSEDENILKYEDYYAGTGRDLSFARTIAEGVAMGGAAPPRLDAGALMSAFPYDIWDI